MFRCTTLEKKAIQNHAKKSGMTDALYCRNRALLCSSTYKLTSEEVECYKLLIEVKTNFTRISNLVKNRKDIMPELNEVIALVNQHLVKFK